MPLTLQISGSMLSIQVWGYAKLPPFFTPDKAITYERVRIMLGYTL